MAMRSEEEILKAIKKEENRLKRIFKKEAENKIEVAISLIERAAFMRVHLEELETNIQINGWTEMFSQSPEQEPYERERPTVKQWNTMSNNYKSIMKQLNDLLPINVNLKSDDDELLKFLSKKK